jgi:hypothetical protein
MHSLQLSAEAKAAGEDDLGGANYKAFPSSFFRYKYSQTYSIISR